MSNQPATSPKTGPPSNQITPTPPALPPKAPGQTDDKPVLPIPAQGVIAASPKQQQQGDGLNKPRQDPSDVDTTAPDGDGAARLVKPDVRDEDSERLQRDEPKPRGHV